MIRDLQCLNHFGHALQHNRQNAGEKWNNSKDKIDMFERNIKDVKELESTDWAELINCKSKKIIEIMEEVVAKELQLEIWTMVMTWMNIEWHR